MPPLAAPSSLPNPWKPPPIPFTSTVGRPQLRSKLRETCLTEKLRSTSNVENLRVAERQLRPSFPFPILERLNLIVKARHRDVAIGVVQLWR
jgi:hypothetical protein